jgi:Mn-containing catalase
MTKREGMQKAFLKGSNSSCRGHARQHWELYQLKCKENDIPIHHWAIPRVIWKAREKERQLKGKQPKLDGTFERVTGPKEFTRDGVLHAVAQFVACDDQVRIRDLEDLIEMY